MFMSMDMGTKYSISSQATDSSIELLFNNYANREDYAAG